MILIDALYINNGGGKVLLDYLISSLENQNKKVFYLLDKRVENCIPKISNKNKVLFLKASLYARRNFYITHRTHFSTVLCFGNLPPNIKLTAKIYTYFHQPLYITIPSELKIINKLILTIKVFILKKLIKNTDYWIVQSNFMKKQLAGKFSLKNENILVLPFYPPLDSDVNQNRIKDQFIYISNAPKHKNHEYLIEAFSDFYQEFKKGKLILTVSNKFPSLVNKINEKAKIGIPIYNIGFVNRSQLSQWLKSSEYLIYPSLAESFGLGLIEGIENGCKIIGADLPYTYEVCDPSIIFNPKEQESIYNALVISLENNTKDSIPKISNKINQLMNLLK